jgi:tRNA modification GTPase
MAAYSGSDTIFALSSGRPPSGVVVIRVSGPDALKSLEKIAGTGIAFRHACLRSLRDSAARVIDTALVLAFKGPASFTGEDSVEFHVHGGPAVVRALLGELGRQAGHRMAQAGEFSLRAFMNGKADLTEMEALSDLIAAETESQRRLAVSQASGRQRALYEGWRADILRLRALSEADLDFSDEEDVPGSVMQGMVERVAALAAVIEAHAATMRTGEIIRDGFKVALVGPPNAGKSSLLNALARRDVAIVTDQPGTTRDLVRVDLDLNGTKIVLTDTAGLRETEEAVEAIGIARALDAARSADLVIALSDDGHFSFPEARDVIIVLSKDDEGRRREDGGFSVSALTGAGVDRLLAEIGRRAGLVISAVDDGVIVSQHRQAALLQEAVAILRHYEGALSDGPEFAADTLRRASDVLGRITGTIHAEDVLGAIFSSFCIGK